MDTSKEYIEMCEQAEEIQKIWDPAPLDLFWDTFGQEINNWRQCSVGYPSDYDGSFEKDNTLIWLPRQDQLQGMVIGNYQCAYDMNLDFTMWAQQIGVLLKKERSMEQLWLVFVMEEKYEKKWAGKNWVGRG